MKIGNKNTPGFHAILGSKLSNLAARGSFLGGWNGLGWAYTGKAGLAAATGATTDSVAMAFDNGGFELENAKNYFTMFTCQVAGVYAVEANLLYDGTSGDYYRLIVAKNVGDPARSGDPTQINAYMNAGMHAIRGQASGSPYSLSVSGFMIMKKGDTATVHAFGTKPYHIDNPDKGGGGGFSMALVHALSI